MKTLKLIIFLIPFVILGCGGSQILPNNFEPMVQENPDNHPTIDTVNKEPAIPPPGYYSDKILADLGLDPDNELTDKELTLIVRDFVYINNQWGDYATPLNINGDFLGQYQDWQSGIAKYFCGGSGHVMAWMLEEIGVPSRVVSLATKNFLQGTSGAETHVTTEVYLDGKWAVQDPTFNVSFKCNDNDAAILDLVECVSSGGQVTWVPGQNYFGVGHTIEENSVPYVDYLAAYSFNYTYKSRLRYEPIPDSPFIGWAQ